MKKFIYFFAVFVIFFGCEDSGKIRQNEDRKVQTSSKTSDENLSKFQDQTKAINQTIDEAAARAKIINKNLNNIGEKMTQNVDKFIKENQDQIEVIKASTNQFLSEANRSFNSAKIATTKIINEANSTIENLLSDINSTFSKPLIINNGDHRGIFHESSHNDVIKQITRLKPNLIQKVTIESYQNSTEVTIDGANPISKAEFEELAKDIAIIITAPEHSANNGAKITIYYINDITKFSGKF